MQYMLDWSATGIQLKKVCVSVDVETSKIVCDERDNTQYMVAWNLRVKDGVLIHPVDFEACKTFDAPFVYFPVNRWKVRLAPLTKGFDHESQYIASHISRIQSFQMDVHERSYFFIPFLFPVLPHLVTI